MIQPVLVMTVSDDGVLQETTVKHQRTVLQQAQCGWTAGGTDFNPGMTETWYDGIDSDCDGAMTLMQDGDGYEPIEYDDGTGNMVAHGGTDCKDDQVLLTHHLLWKQILQLATMTTTVMVTVMTHLLLRLKAYGVIAGTDCYDFSDTTYPGAAYMEADVDGDGMDDCTRDADGDGWGNPSPSIFYNATAGTDCDDSDVDLAPDWMLMVTVLSLVTTVTI